MTDETTEQGTGTAVANSPIPELTKEQIEEARKTFEKAFADLPPPREDIYAYAEYWRKKKLKEMEKFCCPICGSKEYEEETKSNGIIGPASSSTVTDYYCSGLRKYGVPKT